jgi:hypothetical protein
MSLGDESGLGNGGTVMDNVVNVPLPVSDIPGLVTFAVQHDAYIPYAR